MSNSFDFSLKIHILVSIKYFNMKDFPRLLSRLQALNVIFFRMNGWISFGVCHATFKFILSF